MQIQLPNVIYLTRVFAQRLCRCKIVFFCFRLSWNHGKSVAIRWLEPTSPRLCETLNVRLLVDLLCVSLWYAIEVGEEISLLPQLCIWTLWRVKVLPISCCRFQEGSRRNDLGGISWVDFLLEKRAGLAPIFRDLCWFGSKILLLLLKFFWSLLY